MKQPRLNFNPPMSRSSDPPTSDIAEAKHIKSGKRKRNCDLILEAIKANPDCTSAELGELTGLDRVEAARRCSDLRLSGLSTNPLNKNIHNWKGQASVYGYDTYKRKCRVTKSLCIVWRAV